MRSKQGTSGRLIRLSTGVSIFSASVLWAGCASWHGESRYESPWVPAWKRGESTQVSFEVGLPGTGWRPYGGDNTQVAWNHVDMASVIQVRGQCQEHGDSTLEMFTQHIAADFTDWTLVALDSPAPGVDGSPAQNAAATATATALAPDSPQLPLQEHFRLVGRDALRSRVHARLDGVEVHMELVLVKKNGCLFDLMYIASPQAFSAGVSDFRRVVDGFRYPVGAR